MSKRRQPNEVVRRRPGSCFFGEAEPSIVRLSGPQDGFLYDGFGEDLDKVKAAHPEADWRWLHHPCMLGCGDDECIEWANVQVVGGPHDGQWLCHLAECEMEDYQS